MQTPMEINTEQQQQQQQQQKCNNNDNDDNQNSPPSGPTSLTKILSWQPPKYGLSTCQSLNPPSIPWVPWQVPLRVHLVLSLMFWAMVRIGRMRGGA